MLTQYQNSIIEPTPFSFLGRYLYCPETGTIIGGDSNDDDSLFVEDDNDILTHFSFLLSDEE